MAKGVLLRCGVPDITFSKEVQPEQFEHVGDINAQEAMALMCNIKIGLEENRSLLTEDFLCVLEQELYGQFEKLGVSKGVGLPLAATFSYVWEARKRASSPLFQSVGG